ncbi:MAG: SgcJ/EcaC family oxidoreductase [Pseudomonadota bacterium]|nr:SgcJ/EcaC family oxidoreductase [Pseudomonadota bacterium]MEE3099133.1 SgcJ/EcaC family oxidoreductase [Pseudomonadota bacterium]
MAGGRPGAGPGAPEPEAEAARLARAFLALWSAHDADGLAALFAGDADFVNVAGLWWHGAGRIGRTHGVAFRTYFTGAVLTEERLETRALGPFAAVARVRARMEGQTGPDGRPAGARRTMLILVCEARPEGWRIVAAQNTDIAEGAETLVADAATGALAPARYA